MVNGKKVAVIGSGPAGIAAAYYLSVRGYEVTLYEKHSKLGGLLRYGIPDFRLPKEILDNWLEKIILNANIKVEINKQLGKEITLQELKKYYDSIILAFGANISNSMNIPGEQNDNVIGGNELLEYRKFPDFTYKKVAVIGGGNVAIDAARTIKKLDAKNVYIIYRRAEEQMPAERKEIEAAKKEGIEFIFQTNVLKIVNKDELTNINLKRKKQSVGNDALVVPKIECIKTELVQKEGEIRKSPINIEGTNYFMDIDYVIMAVGSHPNEKLVNHLELETTKWGYIQVNENYQTSDEKIYAVGDLIGTKQTVAWAARSGFECAKKIVECDKLQFA